MIRPDDEENICCIKILDILIFSQKRKEFVHFQQDCNPLLPFRKRHPNFSGVSRPNAITVCRLPVAVGNNSFCVQIPIENI